MFTNHNAFLLCLLGLITMVVPLAAQQKFVFEQPKMGSPFVITLYGNDSLEAAGLAKAAFLKVDTLNSLFSDYMPESALNRLCRSEAGAWVKADPLLVNILQRSLVAARMSDGFFDITIGPVVQLWRRARQEKKLPDKTAVSAALDKVSWKYLHCDVANASVRLDKKGMQLDLGGIAKGYAAQYIMDFLRASGQPVCMVDAGGDLALGEPPPGKAGWRIAINAPEQKDDLLSRQLLLKNQAVATSGDIYQFLEIKGKRYSHIINPKTGMGVTFQRNVTVVAPDGATADWLASACSILPVRRAIKLVQRVPGAALLIAEKRKKSSRLYIKSTPEFRALQAAD